MDPIFLTPDVTVDVSIKTTFSKRGTPSFSITDGGPYKIRTATGREFSRIQQVMGSLDAPAAYSILPDFLVGGVEKEKIPSLHPDVVWEILLEVLKRSHVSEEQAGK